MQRYTFLHELPSVSHTFLHELLACYYTFLHELWIKYYILYRWKDYSHIAKATIGLQKHIKALQFFPMFARLERIGEFFVFYKAAFYKNRKNVKCGFIKMKMKDELLSLYNFCSTLVLPFSSDDWTATRRLGGGTYQPSPMPLGRHSRHLSTQRLAPTRGLRHISLSSPSHRSSSRDCCILSPGCCSGRW